MKESSIEEDIKHLEKRIDLNRQMYLEFGRLLSLDEETVNAIENLINKNKELQKENEELKEYNMTYKRILGLADNRIYRKKYLEERRKEQPNLLYPDSDEIYRRYYELKEENEHLHREINRRIKLKIENEKIVDTQFIYKQKIKDKIEEKIQEAEKDLQKAIELEKETKTKEDSILWWAAQIRLDEKIKVLKEILKEVKKMEMEIKKAKGE